MEEHGDIGHTTIERPSSDRAHKSLNEFNSTGNFMLHPDERTKARRSPSPVPSSEARVRWAMLASLAGVRDDTLSERETIPDVTFHDDRGQSSSPSYGQENQSRILIPPSPSPTQRSPHLTAPKRPKTTPLGPHIPIRSRPGSVHKPTSQEVRPKIPAHTDISPSISSNPTSIEHYLKSLRDDPFIDDRGLRDGLQSLMLGSGVDDHERRSPNASSTSKVGQSGLPSINANSIPRHSEDPVRPDGAVLVHKPPSINAHAEIPELHSLGANTLPKATDRQKQVLSPSKSQVIRQGPPVHKPEMETPSSNHKLRAPTQSYESRHGLDDKRDQIHKSDQRRIPDNISRDDMSRMKSPDPSPSLAKAGLVRNRSKPREQQIPHPPPITAASNSRPKREPSHSQSDGGSQHLQPEQHPSKQTDASPSNLSSSQAKTQHEMPRSLKPDSTSTKPAPPAGFSPGASGSGPFMPIQPLPTPPQTPNLPVTAHHSPAQESRESEPMIKEHRPYNTVAHSRPTCLGSTGTNSIPKSNEFRIAAEYNAKTFTSPQVTNQGEKTPQQARISHVQIKGDSKRSQSPAAAIRAQVAKEREEKAQAQQKRQEQLAGSPEPASSMPPISGPQAMLNMVREKSQASIDASNGNPGFIDQMIQLLCKMAQDAMPEIERRLAHNSRVAQRNQARQSKQNDSESGEEQENMEEDSMGVE